MVDANQGWRVAVIGDAPLWDLERATRFCEAADELGFLWVEEPLAHDAYDACAELRRRLARTGVGIAGGELNSQGAPEFRVLLEKGCFDIYQPDAVFTGGISGTWEIVENVRAAGFKYSPHTWTNGVGFAINLQLYAATLPGADSLLEYPLVPPGWVPEARDGVLRQPWLHDRGRLTVPELPGLGFEIDHRALSRHGTRMFVADRLRVSVRAVLDRGFRRAREIGRIRETRLAARALQLEADGSEPA